MPAMIDRRELMAALGSAAVVWPMTAHAQQQAMPVIGFVTTTVKHAAGFLENVRKGLAEYGYIEGQNYRFEIKENNFQNVGPILYQQLVEQKVTLIITAATIGVERAKVATQSISHRFYNCIRSG